MNLFFKEEYKSIRHLPIARLPEFTIVTGENGAGKTHFLEAIKEGSIVLENISKQKIRYYNWSNLIPSDENGVIPRSGNNDKAHNSTSIFKFVEYCLDIYLIYVKESTGELGKNLRKEHLLESVSKGALYMSLDIRLQGKIVNTLNNLNEYLIQGLNSGAANGSGFVFDPLRAGVNSISNPNNLNSDHCFALLQILEITNKKIYELTKQDCSDNYPLITKQIDPFTGALTKLFAAYIREREINDLNQIRYARGDADSFLTEDQFLIQFGLPPWEIINEVLAEAKLNFRFQRPNPDANRQLNLQLRHTLADIEVKFSSLSSGERILISMAQFLFLSQDNRQPTDMPDVILLDEVDAPLHPSMTAAMLRIIENVMVKQHGRQVILATHSPSTVALSSEQAVHVMEANTKLLRKATRDEGVRVLTAGVPILSINLVNRRQVFVESQHDVVIFEAIVALVQSKLEPDISLTFIASGHDKNGGCARVKSLVADLVSAGNNSVFGIVDWDGDINRITTRHLRVLGNGARYSIENYLFDPLLLAAFLFREKLIGRDVLTLRDDQSHIDIRDFGNDRLQVIADNVLRILGPFPYEVDDLESISIVEGVSSVKYINGCIIQLPNAYLHGRGHSLEAYIRNKFPALRKFNREPTMKMEIIKKVLDELPGLIPADLVDLMLDIQKQ